MFELKSQCQIKSREKKTKFVKVIFYVQKRSLKENSKEFAKLIFKSTLNVHYVGDGTTFTLRKKLCVFKVNNRHIQFL